MNNVEALREDIRTNHLNDPEDDIWSDNEIEDAIYSGELTVQTHKPSSTSTYVQFTCAAGSRQNLFGIQNPSAASILDIDRNGSSSVSGKAIVRTTRQNLDRFDPAWQQATQSTEAREFSISEVEPLVFYLNPPVVVNTNIMLTYSAVPSLYGSVNSNTVTTVRSEYREIIKQFALYVLFSKHKEGSPNFQRGQTCLQLAGQLLGVDLQMRMKESTKNPVHDN